LFRLRLRRRCCSMTWAKVRPSSDHPRLAKRHGGVLYQPAGRRQPIPVYLYTRINSISRDRRVRSRDECARSNSRISVRADSLANTREFRPVTGHLSDRQLGAPCLGIELFSGLPKQTVAGLRKGGNLRVLVRGATQGNTLQYRRPICDVRPYDRYQHSRLQSGTVRAYRKRHQTSEPYSNRGLRCRENAAECIWCNASVFVWCLSEGQPFALFSNDGRHRSRARVQLDGCSVNLSTEIVRYRTPRSA